MNETRGLACEIVAWRFVTHITEREAIDYLLYELSPAAAHPDEPEDPEAGIIWSLNLPTDRNLSGERTPLLNGLEPPRLSGLSSHFGTDRVTDGMDGAREEDSFAASFESLNALEIAAICGAKKFLSQRVIQKMINGIWRGKSLHALVSRCGVEVHRALLTGYAGDTVFWETLSTTSVKKARIYNKK